MNELSESLRREGLFNIQVKTIQGIILKFTHVNGYDIEPGDFIFFIDSKTGNLKRFHTSNCEISEIKGDSDE